MHPTMGALSAREIAWRLIKGSGQPYASFHRFTEAGEPEEVGVVETPNSSWAELGPIPPDVDMVRFSATNVSCYFGGDFYCGEQVAQIDDPSEPNLAQEFVNHHAWGVVRIRSGLHYVLLPTADCLHVPLDDAGQPMWHLMNQIQLA